MFDRAFLQAGRRIHAARLVSFVGSAFSEFAIPLFLYHETNNALHIGLQWSLIALTKLFAGQFASRFHWGRTDRRALVHLDLFLACTALLPLIFLNVNLIVGTYLCTFFTAFLTTIQAGYIDSLVGHAAEKETKPEAARSWLLSKIENGRHLGMMLGYGLAFYTSAKFGFEWAIAFDSATFVLSAVMLMGVSIEGQARVSARPEPAYRILFRPAVRTLTITQLLVGFGLYTYNASFVVFLKRDLLASDGMVSLLFVLQYIGYTLGSLVPGYWVAKFKEPLPDRSLLLMRIAVVPLFVLFSFAPNGLTFVVTNAVLSLVIAAQLPLSVGLFQRAVSSSQLRAAGAARIAVTSFSGAFGAAVASAVLKESSGRVVFAYGAAVYAIAAILLAKYFRERVAEAGAVA
jgi:MFS family permease